MNSLLSAISGQFNKSLLLSTMLPVVVFLLLAWVLLLPLIPQSTAWRAWISGLDTEWQVATVSLAVLLLTALLFNLNGLVVRFYEGYPWKDSWTGKRRAKAHQKEFVHRRDRWHGFHALLSREDADLMEGYRETLSYWSALARSLNKQFPTDESAVLPTRLGNVIRSFEDYPNRQYKIESITLWPRLISRIDEQYSSQIGDAKSSLDFMLNSSLLCGLLALLFGSIRLYYPVGLVEPSSWLPALLVFGALLTSSYLLYGVSLSRAGAWGELVKGAFDLYRMDLLKALGPWEVPSNQKEETDLWDKISNRIIYSDLTTPPPAYRPATPPPTSAKAAQPAPTPLEVARGAVFDLPRNALTIHLDVRNPDPSHKALGVSVQDQLPEGWLLEWGTARTADGAVEASGTNPYHFSLGDLDAGRSVHLTYRIVRYAAPAGSQERTD